MYKIMGFTVKNGKLNKVFEFKNFSDAILFINNVAKLAEDMNHHPDIKLFNYKFVEIDLFTHSESKISEKDYDLAKSIENIL